MTVHARPFKALLAILHRDAVACALADYDADRDGREPDQRDGALALALECTAGQDLGFALTPTSRPAVEYWLRCYDRMAATVREPPPPFVAGQRVIVTAGSHRGRLGTVKGSGDAEVSPTIELDLDPSHTASLPLAKRWTKPADFAAWVQ